MELILLTSFAIVMLLFMTGDKKGIFRSIYLLGSSTIMCLSYKGKEDFTFLSFIFCTILIFLLVFVIFEMRKE